MSELSDELREIAKLLITLHADKMRAAADELERLEGIVVKQRLDNSQLTIFLMAADKVMLAIDDQVKRNLLGSRTAIADARLCYGEPFEYKYIEAARAAKPIKENP